MGKFKTFNTCLIVTCVACDTPNPNEESPKGCIGCDMLNWLCFNTEEEANYEFKKQYPTLFDENGNYKR
jgi:hypothetical protein